MEELELFILRIPDFNQKTAAELIDFFAFSFRGIVRKDHLLPHKLKIVSTLYPYHLIPIYLHI
ncbi:MAG: hypothetical protein LUH17_06215 [Acidaminococcaceae bacterium]|nr:hypothetical protein [Acidaminococcaceae bacterium]